MEVIIVSISTEGSFVTSPGSVVTIVVSVPVSDGSEVVEKDTSVEVTALPITVEVSGITVVVTFASVTTSSVVVGKVAFSFVNSNSVEVSNGSSVVDIIPSVVATMSISVVTASMSAVVVTSEYVVAVVVCMAVNETSAILISVEASVASSESEVTLIVEFSIMGDSVEAFVMVSKVIIVVVVESTGSLSVMTGGTVDVVAVSLVS